MKLSDLPANLLIWEIAIGVCAGITFHNLIVALIGGAFK